MVKLGISVYPEQVSLEQIATYCEMASRYGFTKVFTSMFSVQGSKEELITYFKEFASIAHRFNMEVAADANPELFERLGATIEDLSPFKEIGIDTIRMDIPFGDIRDVTLINNPFGIKIELTAMATQSIDQALDQGAHAENLVVCHNFYPQRFTAMDLGRFIAINEHWKGKNVNVAAFVSSQAADSHGPWPVKDGLPTVEDHRLLPIDVQVRHMLALDNVSEILIGNAFACEEELKVIQDVVDSIQQYPEVKQGHLDMIMSLFPNFGNKKVLLKVKPEATLSDFERHCLFDFKLHADLGDGTSYMLRSRFTRGQNKAIPVRPCDKPSFTRGDIVIVNQEVAHYQGEVQIVLKDMENDGQRNLLGTLDANEQILIDCIGTGDIFGFKEVV